MLARLRAAGGKYNPCVRRPRRGRLPADVRILTALMLAASVSACRSAPAPAATDVAWRRVASWSGRGNQQLETFAIEGWIWRVHWEARNESSSGAGRLRVAALSADSGREIDEITDVRGNDHDVKYLSDLPRRYYLTVVSAGVDWSLIVEEPEAN
jgi:hypothetical protein